MKYRIGQLTKVSNGTSDYLYTLIVGVTDKYIHVQDYFSIREFSETGVELDFFDDPIYTDIFND